jgi:hypothetical protein
VIHHDPKNVRAAVRNDGWVVGVGIGDAASLRRPIRLIFMKSVGLQRNADNSTEAGVARRSLRTKSFSPRIVQSIRRSPTEWMESGRSCVRSLAAAAKPDTILGWYRKLIANKFDGSKFRRSVGRPRVDQETERLVVQMARENPSWGYDRIVGFLANPGHRLSDQTVGNILCRRDFPPAPQWKKG